ncbi:hypothetical protein [uncultured Pontibacter sp.]|uniref:hypothetical protein n=1 Tax=uncultured Pontibacter sp. TaxID=453356 RepID=UPI00260283DA|nr:hypothetical protein [uncultured Pontibacter sp.]
MIATLPRGAAFLLPFCSGRAKMLSSLPFPIVARSTAGFLAVAGLVAATFVLAFEEEFVAVVLGALATLFDLGAALATSSTAAVVCFFMFI